MKRENTFLSVLIAVLFVAVVILSILLFMQVKDIKYIKEKIDEERKNTEVENKILEYLDGQIDYYEYNLKGLKAFDEERGYYYE